MREHQARRLATEPDDTLAILGDEFGRDLRRRPPRAGSAFATRCVAGVGAVSAIMRFVGAETRLTSSLLRAALEECWDRNPHLRGRIVAAGRGDRNAAMEILATIRDDLPTRVGRFGPEVVPRQALPRAPRCSGRVRSRRPRPRARRAGHGGHRRVQASRAGPDDAGGDEDPAGDPGPHRLRELHTGGHR